MLFKNSFAASPPIHSFLDHGFGNSLSRLSSRNVSDLVKDQTTGSLAAFAKVLIAGRGVVIEDCATETARRKDGQLRSFNSDEFVTHDRGSICNHELFGTRFAHNPDLGSAWHPDVITSDVLTAINSQPAELDLGQRTISFPASTTLQSSPSSGTIGSNEVEPSGMSRVRTETRGAKHSRDIGLGDGGGAAGHQSPHFVVGCKSATLTAAVIAGTAS
jgi:hypothetical protein